MRHILRSGLILLLVFAGLAIGGGLYLRVRLRASLPQLNGERRVPGLTAAVTVARDGRGVPTITGATREDVALALGFVHAQDRFFQMDLQRRQPAGELSALVGEAAFPLDARMRLHRFRHVAEEAYARTTPEWRAIVDAYATGVNAGLDALGAPPFEYLLLGATPAAWRPEDTILSVLAMFDSLQGRQAGFEETNQQLRLALPEPMFRFLATAGSDWETPAAGAPLARPPIPGPDVLNLRAHAGRSVPPYQRPADDSCASGLSIALTVGHACDPEEAAIVGSNNWAVDGAHSAGPGALIANDMHLPIGVPNIWYRASQVFPDAADPVRPLQLTGVTLPGVPTLVVGSTGFVAWGFTNTGGDWSDLVRIEPDPRDSTRYLAPDGPEPYSSTQESIEIKGAAPRTVTVRSTRWGPLVWTDVEGREYAQHWLAHDPVVVSSDLSRLERTRTVDELLAAAATIGIPNQNLTMADRTGRIAWTVGGFIPRRVGFDGFVPESWADGTKRWDGYLPAVEYPRIVDPREGRIWTANAPVVDGAMLGRIGDGGYADAIRARIIRNRLQAIPRATPEDMLSVQLDDEALFLDRWRTVALDVLAGDNAAGEHQASRASFRHLVETTWTGFASTESVAYRLVRTFRANVVRHVMTFLTAPARSADPSFDYTRSTRAEGPVWQVITERPLHLLDPRFASWEDLLLSAIDETTTELTSGGISLDTRTWGEVNRARIEHPLAAAVPLLGRWLDMPASPLPGDVFTPRAHSPRAGPTERMIVSPGHEQDGILHMPTGQSAHPLSPHYADMHAAWLAGEAVPFLPGPATDTLRLVPQSQESSR